MGLTSAMDVDSVSEDYPPHTSVTESSAAKSPFSTAFQAMLFNSPATPPPLLTQSGCPHCKYQLPKRFRDYIPDPPAPVLLNPDLNPHPVRQIILIVCDHLMTAMNSFEIWREYPERPSVDPDST
jgi:hypothetical protein